MDSPPSHWPRVWRGESSGNLFETFDHAKTMAGSGFFFAQDQAHADWYAGGGTAARAFILDPGTILDLRDPYDAYIRNPKVRTLINALRDEFDEWVDRQSGEEGHPNDWLAAGNLYDYEGDGRGDRWHFLFRLAWAHGFDSVVIHDATDSPHGQLGTTWVVQDPARILPDPERVAAVPVRHGMKLR